jgi:anthranilate phosphoribosyltransferase
MHPAMKYAAEARKQLAKKTIFNILGPLSNPASATHQLIGVYDMAWTEKLAYVLSNLGTKHALVVHGDDGLDEITTSASTQISELRQGNVNTYRIKPQDFGIPESSLDDLTGGDASINARILLAILKGEDGPKRDIVILNAAASLYAADKVSSIANGINLAKDSIDSGKALAKLDSLIDFSRR